MNEEWKEIKDTDGNYQISNKGIVYSHLTHKTRKPSISKLGYKTFTLRVGGKTISKYLHKLLAELFIPNPDGRKYVNHKDGNKLNNNLENLEWCTQRENIIHASDAGLLSKRRSNINKLNNEQVIDIFLSSESKHILSKKYNISKEMISRIKAVRSHKYIINKHLKMASFIYLKQSDQTVKVGDLTTEGLVKEKTAASDFIIQINTNETDVFGEYDLQALTPLLIMDAPEKQKLFTNDEEYQRVISEYNSTIENLKQSATPFYSNEQVYKYLQSKGIKPAADVLIEFDGEVLLTWDCVEDETTERMKTKPECTYETGECDKCKKVAIIKDTEVKQESEDEQQILKDWKKWEDCIRSFISANHKTVDFDKHVKEWNKNIEKLPKSAYER